MLNYKNDRTHDFYVHTNHIKLALIKVTEHIHKMYRVKYYTDSEHHLVVIVL